MCSLWKDHPVTSIFIFYAIKFLWWLTGLPSIEKILQWWVMIWMGVEPIVCIFKLKTSELSWGDAKLIWHVLWSNPQLPWYDVNLIYFIIFVCSKPLSANPLKKITQHAPSSYATPVTPFAGGTGSTALSAAKAWNFCRQTAEFLEGLKNRDVDQQGNMFTHSLFLSLDLFGWLAAFSICSVG
jgi:hypothetical protein